jgi:hypothetical protein
LFSFPNLGGITRVLDASGSLATGYVRVRPTNGTTPSGLLLVQNRQSGILVNETVVPAAPLLASGRTYFEVNASASLTTVLSFANPNPRDVTMTFELRNSEGIISQAGSFVLAASETACDASSTCNQLTASVHEGPFASGLNSAGTFTFASTEPIAVSAFRAFHNEREPSDLLLTNQPVIDMSMSPSRETQVIPYFGVSGIMRTEVVLTNPTGTELQGRMEILDRFGNAGFVRSGDVDVNTIDYSIAPNSVQRFNLTQGFSGVLEGSILVSSLNSDSVPSALAIVSYAVNGITVSEAGIAPTMGTAFRTYAQLSNSPKLRTYIGIANPNAMSGSIQISVTDLSGNLLDTRYRTIGPRSETLVALTGLFRTLPISSFRGIVRIETTLPTISVFTLRQQFNEREPSADLLSSAVPPVVENAPYTTQELVFPGLRTGDGSSTEIILFSGTSGATSEGEILLVRPDGVPLELPTN